MILNQMKSGKFYKIISNKTICKNIYYYLRNNKNNDIDKKTASFYDADPPLFIKIVLKTKFFR